MAGKKAFLPDQALDKAMRFFWDRGYEGTSIKDLVQCTALGRGSLYDTFGDKHALYLAALRRYCVLNRGQMITLRDQQGPLLERLENFFQSCIELLLQDPDRRGCFLVNATLDLAPHDLEVNEVVQSALREIEEGFYHILIQAQVAGELAWTCDPHQYAHFLQATLIGIRALARARANRQALQDIVKTALLVFR